jgi:DNA polymerase-1
MDFWHDYELSTDTVDRLSEKAYLSEREFRDLSGETAYVENAAILSMEHDLLPVLARMEMRGVAIDAVRLREIGERMSREIQALEKIIHETVGEKFNINSSKQLQDILF